MGEDKLSLRSMREDRGKTQTEVANELGVSIQTYGNWERKFKPIPEKRLSMVSKVMGVKLEHLRSEFGRKLESMPAEKPGRDGSSRMLAKKIIDTLPCPSRGAKFSSRKSMLKICNNYKLQKSKCRECRMFKENGYMPDGVVIDESILNGRK